jgi:hypothetical protein
MAKQTGAPYKQPSIPFMPLQRVASFNLHALAYKFESAAQAPHRI